MTRLILAIFSALAVTLSTPSISGENTAKAETGKIIVYRENSKLGASFVVFADAKQVGRLREGRSVSIEVPAGEHTIASNIKGSDVITINVIAGETTYINGQLMKKRSGKFSASFDQVTEDIALASDSRVNDRI